MASVRTQHFETLEARQLLAADFTLGVGRFSDSAYTSDGILCVVWYDPAEGNLKFSLRDTDGTWEAPSIIDDTADVGQYPSLAIDHNGQPAVTYYDASNADLKGAMFNGSTWDIATIDSVGRVGMYSSLAFDASNNAIVTYYDRSHGDLKLAHFNGDTWDFSVIDSAGDAGRYSSLVQSPTTGRWAVAYEENTQGLFEYAGQTKSGTWSKTVVDDTQAGGGYVSLAFNSTGSPAFSYYDSFGANLKYANYGAKGWVTQTVAAKGTVGLYSNLLLPTAGPSIYYFNKTLNQVVRASSATGATWTFSTVKLGGGADMSVTTTADGGIRSLVWNDSAANELLANDVN